MSCVHYGSGINYLGLVKAVDVEQAIWREAVTTVVNVSIPPDQLTMNRVELHILLSDGVESVRTFDFCEDNLTTVTVEFCYGGIHLLYGE